jgi:signal transduction histidine kinase
MQSMSATTLNTSSTRENSQAQGKATFWQILVGALGVVTILAFVVYLVGAINLRNRPFLGAMVTSTLTINAGVATGDEVWTGKAAGLQANDQLLSINGESLFGSDPNNYAAAEARLQEILSTLPRTADGFAPVSVTFLRPNALQTDSYCENNICTLSFLPMSFPDVDLLSYFVLPFVAGIVLLVLGGVVLRYKFNSPEGLLAAVIAFLSAIYAGGIFDIGTEATLAPLWLVGTSVLGASLASLGISFPKRLKFIRNIKYVEHVLILLGLGIGGFIAYQFAQPARTAVGWTPVATVVAIIGLLSLWISSVWQRSMATTPASRDQSNTVFIGTTVMIVPIAIWLLVLLLPGDVFNVEVLTLLFVFPNAAIIYAVLHYSVLDTDRVISQGTTYLIMVGALILAITLLTLGGTLLAIDLLNVTNNAIMIAIILFLMVLLFVPLRTWLQERIDAIYYRKRRDFTEKLEKFNHGLTTLNNYDGIIKLFRDTMDESVSPASMFLFLREFTGGDFVAYKMNGISTDIRFAANSPLVEYMKAKNSAISLQAGEAWPHELRVDQPRLNLLKARLLSGLMASDTLNGFILLGPPKAKDSYQHEEVRFLESVSSQLAIATERSQVIETLERRVRELDVLSQVGQAVNFTIESDDLLELIHNQTSKLVPVPAFYIVLYEEKIQRLYFAFFLEDDDRFEDKEGLRWSVGNDLFSEIIKSNSAIRLSNFTEEMKKRGAKLDLIKDGLLAWMGVPLTAGRRILGVMAVGKRKDSADYTEEQFKIFSDIGALAATSLDKANLFTQTKIRERQLTVLNDISRQLVATETDVEKLLQIIVTSAVEILNGEAGSLLLHTEDDTGDLSFRVVIGGGGNELLGTRIPKGSGVVGKVVESSESIIVNDVESDPRHNVNVSEFKSRSLLAVPLTSKSRVIGVLEVINKKDGTPFVDEDASLLTTFAGQAAVAIENARLFQQTDLQLSARVKELESLERLDSELNRTLELHDVAEITVRQAMTILSANAGALGIVHQNPPYLEIVAIKGYKREEYPKGVDSDDPLIWPLDEGIVKRVLRSRQADITMDVAIDPDYDSGLTNSNSQITLPMMSGDEVLAVLILEKNTLPRFSLPDWAFAQRIAEHASIAVANAQFYSALRNANKSKSEFMGFAAHELGNPLTSVKGYLDVLGSGMTGALSEQQMNFVNVISSNVSRMQVIIGDLRDSAKIDANEFKVDAEPMNIRNAVVETLRPFVKMLETKNQELVNNVPEDLPLVWGDETRAIQVLTNLVSNAHKYSYEDTTITVDAWLEKNYIDRQGNRRGRMVVVAVRDQGVGMSEEDQKKLFKVRYFRSTNQEALNMASGTGLGMLLTYNIMLQHKGEIWIESQLGKGSSFHISFPLSEDVEKQIKGEPAAD